MNITEAGKLTSLTPNTLRYYERIGLIPPVARNKGGTREYTSKDYCAIIGINQKDLENQGILA